MAVIGRYMSVGITVAVVLRHEKCIRQGLIDYRNDRSLCHLDVLVPNALVNGRGGDRSNNKRILLLHHSRWPVPYINVSVRPYSRKRNILGTIPVFQLIVALRFRPPERLVCVGGGARRPLGLPADGLIGISGDGQSLGPWLLTLSIKSSASNMEASLLRSADVDKYCFGSKEPSIAKPAISSERSPGITELSGASDLRSFRISVSRSRNQDETSEDAEGAMEGVLKRLFSWADSVPVVDHSPQASLSSFQTQWSS